MDEAQFKKLLDYLQAFRQEVDTRFNAHDRRFDDLTSLIDGYADRLDTYAQEVIELNNKVSQLEKYVQTLAESTGVNLNSV